MVDGMDGQGLELGRSAGGYCSHLGKRKYRSELNLGEWDIKGNSGFSIVSRKTPG